MNADLFQRAEIHTELDSRINFAMQQNDVPVVKVLNVENLSSEPLNDLRVCITPALGFANRWESRIDQVSAGATYSLEAVDLELSPGFLSELTERLRGQLRFELFKGEECLFEHTETVELLARDEWNGLVSLPEITAAFVMPNHPEVERILKKASEFLKEWTSDPSFTGYQTNEPKRVFSVAGAVYAALQSYGITYINPPASFESEGQRIRLPDRIIETKLATCMDLALLAAGCLEQTGLNPLVVLVKGHAFVGVWLHNDCFGEPAIDEPLRLRKRVDLQEILVFDPTCATNHPSTNFNRSVAETELRLRRPEEFLCVIDIDRSRKGGIRPIPEQVGRESATSDKVEDPSTKLGRPSAPEIPDLEPREPQVTEDRTGETAESRLDRWRRRLLDLSLRNRLLNFRETKKTIPLHCPDLAGLEDALADGVTFDILPRPKGMSERDPRDPDVHLRRTGGDAFQDLLREELRARRLFSDLTTEELGRRMVKIFRAARLGLEEGGASALYMAVGFLEWYEAPTSQRPRLAPILLIPLELHRRSVREGFTLCISDDEPRINITLLEMLLKDHDVEIPGLDPLPVDESGLDVPKILRAFRERIRDIDRWDVKEIIRIGIFSFTKFIMWRDLTERADGLMNNPVVNHLVNTPNEAFEPGSTFPDADKLDEQKSPLETYCPLGADASQLAAVFAAADGRSFVLEGPPGTGKSQTIANLVAHCLAEGKTLLFVSEKMAALSVVYDRLKSIGLEQHCLEVHSNKARKREVLAQLDAALRCGDARTPEEWEREAGKIQVLREELNAYVSALHRVRHSGDSVFQAISRLIGLTNAKQVPLKCSSPDSIDGESLAKCRELVDRLTTTGSVLGEIHGHAWGAAKCTDWNPAWQNRVRDGIKTLTESIEALKHSSLEVSKQIFTENQDKWSENDLEQLYELAKLMLNPFSPPIELLLKPGWKQILEEAKDWVEHGRRRDALRVEVYQRFSEKILALDLDGLRARLLLAEGSRWPLSWWRYRPIRQVLKRVTRDLKAPSIHELSSVLDQALALRAEENFISGADRNATALLGRYWKKGEADWAKIEELLVWVAGFRKTSRRLARLCDDRGEAQIERWAQIACEEQDLIVPDGCAGQALLEYRSQYDLWKNARHNLECLLDLDKDRAWGSPESIDALGRMSKVLACWLDNLHQLREWCAWMRARTEAVQVNLSPLIEAYEAGAFRSTDLPQVFDRSYYDWWVTNIVSSEPVLAHFFGPEHQRKISQFRDIDEHYLKLTAQLVTARLARKVPTPRISGLPNSEVGILRREIGKRRRHMSVRRLFQTIPNLLPRLKPCLLMSPISVAQYLDPAYPPVDLVVFDEASQIPVWDAVGAIARGKQAVIVGDPKQLPPTSFFQRMDDPEEEVTEAETVEDLESILDDCISARLPTLTLNWHYRSRHESLIAFSNYHYYDNRLFIFPSSQRKGMGVTWRHVPGGIYDRGKTATNRKEADAIVDEILNRLRDQRLRYWSIGVVTFSQAQQTLIEDLLDEVRRSDPEVDAFFSKDVTEPVFVKNLENVQGDERDVILFSICYGPDALGRVSMNFGPMNREGGERRLNVAVTRARREVVVFSTLRADQIDLSKTRARGVRDLKNFLEYAERGPAAIAGFADYRPDADFDSPFEKDVYGALEDKGWQVHQQVGCARYRIDLAVVDPDEPGRYLIGIECDGANYHRAKTARDRDKLREGVLRDLGWELHRIWSTDWWTNRDQEIERLLRALEDAKTARNRPKPPPIEHRTVETQTDKFSSATPSTASTDSPEIKTPTSVVELYPTYSPFPVGVSRGTQEEFYDYYSEGDIESLIVDIVCHEGPICLGLLTRRVAAHWGLRRVTAKALSHIESLLPKSKIGGYSIHDSLVLWPPDLDPNSYTTFRVPGGDPQSHREANDLPIQEIANAALCLLREHISAPENELIRETGRLFGFRRLGKRVVSRMRAGIKYLVDKGVARRDGMTIILQESGEESTRAHAQTHATDQIREDTKHYCQGAHDDFKELDEANSANQEVQLIPSEFKFDSVEDSIKFFEDLSEGIRRYDDSPWGALFICLPNEEDEMKLAAEYVELCEDLREDDDVPTADQVMSTCNEDGSWTEEDEVRFKVLDAEHRALSAEVAGQQISEDPDHDKLAELEEKLEALHEEWSEYKGRKNSLFQNTVEWIAQDIVMKLRLIYGVRKVNEEGRPGDRLWSSLRDLSLEENMEAVPHVMGLFALLAMTFRSRDYLCSEPPADLDE